MPRFLSFCSGPVDWQSKLADPVKQWRVGYSARTLAHCWEASDGFPPEVCTALLQLTDPLLADLVPLLAVSEFKVPLPGGCRASQNDIFVLAGSSAGPVCIMVEGKVNESFGPTLGEWQKHASHGKKRRLKFLWRALGIAPLGSDHIRYQLLHRTASAVITGEQYRAVAAVVLVHSFSADRTGWPDYEAFLRLFGVTAVEGTIQRLPNLSHILMFAGWVDGDGAFLKC